MIGIREIRLKRERERDTAYIRHHRHITQMVWRELCEIFIWKDEERFVGEGGHGVLRWK